MADNLGFIVAKATEQDDLKSQVEWLKHHISRLHKIIGMSAYHNVALSNLKRMEPGSPEWHGEAAKLCAQHEAHTGGLVAISESLTETVRAMEKNQ